MYVDKSSTAFEE